MDDSKALFDYWHERVRLRNLNLIASSGHVQTQNLRHDCTNYDDLRKSREVQLLEEPERSRVIAIIKYECTAQVLQRRSGLLKDRVVELQAATDDVEQQKTRLLSLIRALQEKLFGKDRDIKQLQARISILEAENEALRAESENDKAYAELLQAFEQLKEQYAAIEQRKQQLAKNNQSLGGRVAHTNRYRRERDEARTAIQELRQQLAIAVQQNQQLQQENETLRLELERLRQKI
ncbi:MAG: hypothetical protein ICV62_14835 [Cyanobacteria bacterium Co-bin13]|nr:hypothetical protein [Cyanobacteria bacterium Co-bin13]